MLGPLVTLVFLSFALAWSVFLKAGVQPSTWAVTLLAVGLISCTWWMATRRSHRAPPITPWLKTAILLLPFYIAFQLVPLPARVLELLSPARAVLLTSMAPVVPAISSAPLSVMPPATLLGLFTILCYTATFLLVRELCWQFMTKPWIPAVPLLTLAAAEAALGLIQVFAGAGHATGTYLSYDHYAALLEMVLPFAILYGLTILNGHRKRHDFPVLPAIRACSVWAIAVLLLFAIIQSLSRGGFLATVGTLSFMTAFALCPRIRSRYWRWPALAFAGILITLVLMLSTPDRLINRFAVLSSTGHSHLDPRPLVWHDTLPLIAEFRWFGCGFGAFASPFMKHQTALANFLIGWAHNDYLQLLAELGIVGFILLGTVLAGISLQILRGILKLQDENRRLLVIACAGSFVAIFLHSFVDFNMYVPADAMTLAWVAGIGSINGLD